MNITFRDAQKHIILVLPQEEDQIPWSVEKTVSVERASNVFILQAYLVKPNVWIYKKKCWNELFAEERKTNFQVAAQKYLGLVCHKGEE